MAVITSVPGISAHVRVSGQIATEYADPDGEAAGNGDLPTHRCYIKSTSGSRFAIQVAVDKSFGFPCDRDCVCARIYLDGVWAGGAFVRPKEFLYGSAVRCIDSARVSDDHRGLVKSKFTFSPVSSVDDGNKERVARDRELAKSLGTIEVLVSAVVTGSMVPYQPPMLQNTKNFQLAEKSMKGKEISHGTSFSAGVVTSAPKTTSVIKETKICRFVFIYRSLAALKRELIIPSSPQSTPPVDDMGSLTADEIRELAREMLRLKQGRATGEGKIAKRERKESVGRSNPRSRPLKIVRIEDGKEAIDLTDE